LRDSVAVLAILGGIIELIAAVGGPQLAGVGMLTNEAAPPMPIGPLLFGVAAAAVSIVAGALINPGNARVLAVVLIAAAIVGAIVVGPLTLWYSIAAFFTLLAGVLALFVRRPRDSVGQ
jgi:hypothetical protein